MAHRNGPIEIGRRLKPALHCHMLKSDSMLRSAFDPPGRLLDIGRRRLHLHEMGQGSPVVVLESGIGATSLNWRTVQREVARFTRVVSYDRAGLGWSDPSTEPLTLRRLVDDLHSLLRAAEL